MTMTFGAPRALVGPRVLSSYSRLHEARPNGLHAIEGVDDLALRLRRAVAERRRVTVRAGGRSFDAQALNRDVVLDVRALDRVVRVDTASREVTVQAAAPWGRIVDATLEHGLIPHIVVTTRGATAGGTLAANCLSRCSPRYGHTGDHVRSLELLTVGGERLTCSPERNGDLFRAVIGGFGYFGIVTEATFDLLDIGPRRRVRTEIDRREGLPAFTERLIEASLAPEPYDAVYSVYSLTEPKRGAILRSAYTDEPLGRSLEVYQPFSWYRPLAEFLFMSSRVSNALSHASYRYVFGEGPFVDELYGYTFCMEGNERAKTLADRVGLKMTSLQHSYVVPTESLRPFLETVARTFADRDVYPCLLDALYRPSDDYLLSSANGLPGFCVSFVFEGMNKARYARIRDCFLELNAIALGAGGRLHLGKNVIATQEQLQRMYGHARPRLEALKAAYDPHNVLVNDFFARIFG
jgi:FAD/FMN-containing dehydrogenase